MKIIISLLFIFVFQMNYGQNNEFVEIKNDSIFNSKELEVIAEFPGGSQEFFKFIFKNLEMPETFSGKIHLLFVVEKDGTISNVDIQNGNKKINAEVKRVMKLSPTWKPAKFQDRVVRSRYAMPINLINHD